ncbi:WXG100 family type VII secretion target [Nonomuraea sp. NPDC002799]
MGENKKQTHQLKPARGDWSVTTGGRSVAGVKNFINSIDAKRIEEASSAYGDAHTTVAGVQQAIYNKAVELSKVWEGAASVEAQKALQTLHNTLGELATKLSSMSAPLGTLATVVRDHQAFLDDDWQGFLMPTWHNQALLGTMNDSIADIYRTYNGALGKDAGGSGTDYGSQDELAGKHLKTFGDDLQEIYDRMPNTVEKELRDIKLPVGQKPFTEPITYTGGKLTGPGDISTTGYDPDLPGGPTSVPGMNDPSLGSGDPAAGSIDPTTGSYNPDYTGTGSQGGDLGTGAGTGGPSGVNASTGQSPGGVTDPNYGSAGNTGNTGAKPTTTLQDYQPNAGTSTGATPTGTTPSYGHPATGSSSPNGGTTGGTYGGGGGVTAAGAPLSARSGTGGSNTGVPMMPMGGMGGGGGQESSDRESTTWLHEDDEVYGAGDTQTVNSQIG